MDEDEMPTAALAGPDGLEDDEEATGDYPIFPSSQPLPLSFDIPIPAHSVESALPKRGLKDFEPHPTSVQASTLAKSRAAMHVALSHTRSHHAKTRVVGVYDERSRQTTVAHVKGTLFKTLAKDLPGGGAALEGEEALWALERGSLDLRYRYAAYTTELAPPHHPQPDDGEVGSEEAGIPMSLQAAYAAYIGDQDDGLTADKYAVYAGLKRAGFIVQRAQGFTGTKLASKGQAIANWQEIRPDITSGPQSTSTGFRWLYRLLWNTVPADASRMARGPLVPPGLYRHNRDIYRLLALQSANIPHRTPATDSGDLATYQTPYTTTYNIFQHRQTFRKSAPGPPDFRVCVISARATRLPTLDELLGLLEEQDPDPPAKATSDRSIGATYAALKKGQKNVLLAVVDEGVVSYIRVADAAFAVEGWLCDRESGGFGIGGKGSRGKGPRRGGKGGQKR